MCGFGGVGAAFAQHEARVAQLHALRRQVVPVPGFAIVRETSIPKVTRKGAACPDCGRVGNAHFAGCPALPPEGL
ncbi:hypothetical protein [Pseudogemmobacter bohemicus]|uniref:hypothetical protein n=1 Tax=Pseudogemmobacter bohemicus TaxID=2250708 RepID=UPI000DD3F31F|nr:hypothetical protein [Pseudogemmobacter bohemicus]